MIKYSTEKKIIGSKNIAYQSRINPIRTAPK